MSYFLDQVKRASLNEAADLLAAKYVETVGKRAGIAKSAEIGSSSLYGAAAGAGVGGLGTLGLDYLTGKGVNARRALSGALIGAVPGAAAGALADSYLTPAEKDPDNPNTRPSLSFGGIVDLMRPKIPTSLEELGVGILGGEGGRRLGSMFNNSAWGKGLGILPPKGWKFVEDRVDALNAAHKELFEAKQTAVNRRHDAFQAGKRPVVGGDTTARDYWNDNKGPIRRAAEKAENAYKALAPAGSKDIRFIDTPLTWKDRIKSLLPDWNKSIYTQQEIPAMDMTKSPPVPLRIQEANPLKFRAGSPGKSWVAPGAGGLIGAGTLIGADRYLNAPLDQLVGWLTGTGKDTNAPK